MSTADKEGPPSGYFGHARPEVVALVEPTGARILDVGCAAGAMGAAMLAAGATEVVGLDANVKALELARQRLSAVHLVDLATAIELPYPAGYFDRIVCADVLEHLPDPEAALRGLLPFLAKEGRIVLSIPNVRHHSVLLPLLRDGRWEYQREGVLDRTHLRFFTRLGIDDLLRGAGIERIGELTRCNVDSFRDLEPFADLVARLGGDRRAFEEEATTLQFIIVARRRARAAEGSREAAQDAGDPAAAPRSRSVAAPSSGTARQVSVIIPVHGKAAYTRACIEKIAANTPAEAFEAIFVDNASTDETAALLASLEGDVRVVTNVENRGFVEACNQGAALAQGKYLLFLNNDTAPQSGWLEALVAALEADPSVGAAGARLVYPDGRLQEAGGLIFSDGSGWNFGRGDPEPFAERYNAPAEVDYCSGAALMVRRELFEALGGFDRRYAPAYYEDTDLCFGVRARGFKVVYCPSSIVVHFEGVTAGTSTSGGYKRFQPINKVKFKEKWAAELARQDPPPSITGRAPGTADRRARGLTGQGPAAGAAAVAPPASAPPGERPGQRRVPRVLVVDLYFPAHDRSSGALRIFEILKILRRRGCEVTFIARHGTDQEPYRETLERSGIETYEADADGLLLAGAGSSPRRVDLPRLLEERRFDLAWLSFYTTAETYLPVIRRCSPATTIASDTVDVHFIREARVAKLAGDQAGLLAAGRTRGRELAIYGRSDVVVVVTELDGRILRTAGLTAPTAVIPNIHSAAGVTPGLDGREGLVFVGGFDHRPNRDAAAWLLAEIMPRVRSRIPGVPLAVVGSRPPEELRSLAGPLDRVVGWLQSTGPILDAARVSVAPLRAGAGMKGKVGEALSRGLPVVTTTIGAEGMGLVDGTHLLVADDAEGFATQVERLYRDRDLWGRLAAAGRAEVESRYGVEAASAAVDALLARSVNLAYSGCEAGAPGAAGARSATT